MPLGHSNTKKARQKESGESENQEEEGSGEAEEERGESEEEEPPMDMPREGHKISQSSGVRRPEGGPMCGRHFSMSQSTGNGASLMLHQTNVH